MAVAAALAVLALSLAAASALIMAAATLAAGPGTFLASAALVAGCYLATTLALLASPRRRWGLADALLALLALVPLAMALLRPSAPPAFAPLALLTWVAAPIALALAALRHARLSDAYAGGAARALLGIYAVGLVLQVALNPAVFSTDGPQGVYRYNLLGAILTTLLVGFLLSLGEPPARARVAAVILASGGVLLSTLSMGALLRVPALREVAGAVRAAFMGHALGLGALRAALALAALSLILRERRAKAHDPDAAMDARALV